jgi:putative protease
MTDDAGTARAIRACAPELALAGGQGLNIFNHRAACTLGSLFSSLTLSAELSGTECGELIRLARSHGCQVPFSLVVQGPAEAMITEDCILEPVRQCRKAGSGESGSSFFGIRDNTGHIFPVRVDGACRTRIGNAVETCLLDHLPAIAGAGISDVVIDARGRPEAYAGEMTRIYRQALGYVNAGKLVPEKEAAFFKEQVRARALEGITAGHFVRGRKE